jgi:MFS family permease
VRSRWAPLAVLGTAQFVMVLDTAVMNVSISRLVEDLDTQVTTIQAAITLYALVMAALMLTGAKAGDLFGRRRVFAVGLAIYAVGSGVTALAPTVGVLILGWSLLEGIGAALVLPALAALVAQTYEGRQRAVAYGAIGGVAGAGVAVGPLLGGWITTVSTWRWVFVGEVVIVLGILAFRRVLPAAAEAVADRRFDALGAGLSAGGIGLVVLGVLQAGTWGWLAPRASPVTPFGYALTPFVVTAGAVLLAVFARWQRLREARRRPPLVRLDLLGIPPLRAALSVLLAQNLLLLGVFFTIPLYLQLVLGLDALQTGIRLLPVSLALLVTSLAGPALGRLSGPRRIVRIGLLAVLAGVLLLMGTMQPTLHGRAFAVAMAVLGAGMGLVVSQLGNVMQSSVSVADRSEVGGLQYTAQNLGSALGTALIGTILISVLTTATLAGVTADGRLSPELRAQASVDLAAGVPFLALAEVETALERTALPAAEQAAILEDYGAARLEGLAAAALALVTFALAGRLPARLGPGRAGGPEEHVGENMASGVDPHAT